MRMGRRLKSKRGFALENAILFMVVIFSFCALITSLTLLGHYRAKLDHSALSERVVLQQIGEDYLSSLQSGEALAEQYEGYAYALEDGALTVWRENDQNKRVLFYAKAEYTEGQLHILAWSQVPPQAYE